MPSKRPKTPHLDDQPNILPGVLHRIAAVRDRLINGPIPTDRPDHLTELKNWEGKVQRAVLVLGLRGNDGIKLILAKMEQELRELEELIRTNKPLGFAPEQTAQYAHEQQNLHDKREMWLWFRSLFSDAKRDISEVEDDLDLQEGEENAPGI